MSEPSRNPSDLTSLLYKAVRGLPEHEQAAIFEYLLGLGVSRPAQAVSPHPAMHFGPLEDVPLANLFAGQKGGGANQQIIPVRLSEDTHRRLKEWCADHDFHMSVVVRGLIERFLDGWHEPAAGSAAAER